jgi:hypothetical protein
MVAVAAEHLEGDRAGADQPRFGPMGLPEAQYWYLGSQTAGTTTAPDAANQVIADITLAAGAGPGPRPGEARTGPARCDHQATRPHAATTSGPRPRTLLLTIVPPVFPQRHWAPDGDRSRARAKRASQGGNSRDLSARLALSHICQATTRQL